ncbi:MAG: HAMP domain-containing histidine kinase [Eubacterium sp.]|jgi:Signal transduction histidine kinase|nr:HAMP domain-containing histidine kinase [Eubacterium sp.]
MKGRIIKIFVIFAMLILGAAALFFLEGRKQDSQKVREGYIVAVNELEQLGLQGKRELLSERSAVLQENLRSLPVEESGGIRYFILAGIGIIFTAAVFCYIYAAILRPFDKMKAFAGRVAQGDMNVPLEYERSNYFGDFTWAFDSMRREITRSRASEKETIENNKTVIATLSHDIKTPIASIRAYAEGLEANLDRSVERRTEYLRVLMRKCDEVSKLTNDLFLHSISDLDKLKISEKEFELCGFIEECAGELSAEHHDIALRLSGERIWVRADRNRLLQVCENLVNNSRKYAKSGIEIWVVPRAGFGEVHFKDHGAGIPDEDMPFICDKFYRGRNCGEEQGSGLGLYIVKYILERMGGKLLLHNDADGLEAVVYLRLVDSHSIEN